jgi:TPR repeat protein
MESNNDNITFDEAKHLYYRREFGKAFALYRILAERGNIECQTFVGWMYFKGEGVAKDYDEAKRWISLAADSGDRNAQYSFGLMYQLLGDYENAMVLYQRAAVLGHSAACYQLGKMYYAGLGVRENHVKAYEFFETSARMGHIFAKRQLSLMLIKGYKGLAFIPIGLVLFVINIFVGGWTAITETYSEKTYS